MDRNSLAGRSVLIVGIYYHPEETGIAPYTTAVAEHLAGLGAQVTAVTGMPHYPAWRTFGEYRRRLRARERRGEVELHRGRVFVPRRQTALRRGLYEATFATQAVSIRGLPACDVVLGVIPSLAGGLAAAFHAARTDAALGLVVQDLSGPAATQSGMPGGGGRVARATARTERWLLRRADRIGIVSQGFRTYLAEAGVRRGRVVELPNWSRMPEPTREAAATRRELGWPVDRPIVLHAGNMGLKQGLEHVIEAARLADGTGSPVNFVLMGDGNQRELLERRAAGLPNVTFSAPRYGTDYANALAAADILLVNERSSVLDMSLPSKLTSYFLAGRPVLAAVTPSGVTAREVERSDGGRVTAAEDPAGLLRAVNGLLSDPAEAERLARAGAAYAAKHLSAAAALARAERFVLELVAPSRERAGSATPAS